jgi:hypothetical protein
MAVIWLGVLLIIGGILFMAAQAIWPGRLSEWRSRGSRAGGTLEPKEPARGFDLARSWPGLALIALGAVLLLAAAAR